MKMTLRKMVIEAKEQFTETLKYDKIVESAVHRGFYNGLGGEMDFSIPSAFDLISEAVGKVVAAKLKYEKKTGGVIEGDIEYRTELEKAFKTLKGAEVIGSLWFGMEMPEDKWNLVLINFLTGTSEVVRDAGAFNADLAKRLILTIIKLYDETGEMEKYKDTIEATIEADLKLVFKEGV